MNDPLPKSTEDILRSPLPEAEPRPGFETRLLAQLRDAPARKRPALLLPLGAATALILAAVLALPLLRPAPGPGSPSADNPTPPAATRPVLEIEDLPNPLRRETAALSDRATRTGRFLINCLPSLPDPGNEL